MPQFSVPTKIYFGDNSVLSALENPFVVADAFFANAPLLKKLKTYTLFTDFTPDPTLESVAKGVAAFQHTECKSMVAIGGGSAIDTAKAILHFANSHVPLCAIPTTSGTGSELTAFSVVTYHETHQKYPLVSNEMLPDIAVLDTELIKTVPPKIAADTGADVLCHAIEAYVAIDRNPFSDAFSEKAVQLVFQYLPLSVKGDVFAKEQMHFASAMAGIAFNSAGLGLCHAMAHNIGAKYKIPHGRANAVLLPLVILFNANVASYAAPSNPTAARYAVLSRLLGNSGTDTILVKKLVSDIKNLFHTLGLPPKFDIQAHDLNEIVQGALQDGCLKTNPREATEADILNVYKEVL